MRRLIIELSPIILVITACLLGIIAIPVGIIHRIVKLFYDSKGTPRRERFKQIGIWILKILYQIWVVIRYTFFQIAYILDILSNVLVGEAIEDLICPTKENTMLGNGDISISAAIGDIKRDPKALNKFGRFIDRFLSALDQTHDDHCDSAIRLWEFKKSLRND